MLQHNVTTINKREFLLYTNKYLKMLKYLDRIVVTNRDKIEYEITKASIEPKRSGTCLGESDFERIPVYD